MGIYGEVPGERYRSVLDLYRDSVAIIEVSDLDYTLSAAGLVHPRRRGRVPDHADRQAVQRARRVGEQRVGSHREAGDDARDARPPKPRREPGVAPECRSSLERTGRGESSCKRTITVANGRKREKTDVGARRVPTYQVDAQ